MRYLIKSIDALDNEQKKFQKFQYYQKNQRQRRVWLQLLLRCRIGSLLVCEFFSLKCVANTNM